MIKIYFGNIGSGKTTLAVRIARKLIRKKESLYVKYLYNGYCSKLFKFPYERIFSNFESKCTTYCELKDLGLWTFSQK